MWTACVENWGSLSDRQYWKPSDYSDRLLSRFGRLRGLWRCHRMVSEILEASLGGRHAETTALLCQFLKTLHQVALDKGGWETALLLWVSEDTLGAEAFGGEETEMQQIHLYQKALKELRGKVQTGKDTSGDVEDADGDETAPGPRGRGKAGGRGKRRQPQPEEPTA